MKTAIIISLICLIAGLGLYLKTDSTLGQTNGKKEEPTAVRSGNPSDKDRAYGHELRKIYSSRKGLTITELAQFGATQRSGKEVRSIVGEPDVPTIGTLEPTSMTPGSGDAFLTDLSCKSDAIVVASVTDKKVHLTDDETFAYTAYNLTIIDVLRNNPASPIAAEKSIEVSIPGGLVEFNNQIIRFEDRSYASLKTDQAYLLFLRYIPEASGYLLANTILNASINGERLSLLRNTAIPANLRQLGSSNSWLESIRNVQSNPCSQ